jgi:hypothetical protein
MLVMIRRCSNDDDEEGSKELPGGGRPWKPQDRDDTC